MELRLLRYFLAIVDAGSMTRAAVVIGVAQPSLSRQLRQLERSLGVALFARESGRLRLTVAGLRFLPQARDLVARADATVALMRGQVEGSALRLTLVAPETTVADVIAPFLATQGQDDPTILAREAIPTDVFDEVLSGRADLGISSGPPPGDLTVATVGRFPVLAYVPEGHPLADRGVAQLADLVPFPLILLENTHGTRRLFDTTMAAEGLGYRLAFEAPVPQVAQALAASGRGIAIVTDDPRYGLRPLRIRVRDADLRIPLVGAWSPDHFAAATIERWVRSLADFAAGRPDGAD